MQAGRSQHRQGPGHPAPLRVPRPGPHRHRLHQGPVQRRARSRRKVPARHRSTATPEAITPILDDAARRPGLPALLRTQAPRPGRRPSQRARSTSTWSAASTRSNGRIRNTFESVPDAPVSKLRLDHGRRQEGPARKTRPTSAPRTHRAIAEFDGHNGKISDSNPVVKAEVRQGQEARRQSASNASAERASGLAEGPRRLPLALLLGVAGGRSGRDDPGRRPAHHRPQPGPALQAPAQGHRPDRRLRRRLASKNATGGIPPQLNKLAVKVNRHGLLQSKGLPVCRDARDPAGLHRTSPRQLRRRPDRLRPVLGPHRPSPAKSPTRPTGAS